MRTREEIEKELAIWKQKDFDLGVSTDYFSPEQRKLYGEICEKINELKNELKALED